MGSIFRSRKILVPLRQAQGPQDQAQGPQEKFVVPELVEGQGPRVGVSSKQKTG